jgi:hypothetical protein
VAGDFKKNFHIGSRIIPHFRRLLRLGSPPEQTRITVPFTRLLAVLLISLPFRITGQEPTAVDAAPRLPVLKTELNLHAPSKDWTIGYPSSVAMDQNGTFHQLVNLLQDH